VKFTVREIARRGEGLLRFWALTAALAGPAAAEPSGWTFCVAEGAGARDIWITAVFATSHERDHVESEFSAYLKGRGFAAPVAQCPAPKADKTEMVNAQIVAVEFHRKLGDQLHEVAAAEFGTRR
jgi:hypothetical protein